MKSARNRRGKKRKVSSRDINIENVLRKLSIDFTLNKKDKELCAKCPDPDHKDTNPSWHIHSELGNVKNGLYNCWSCKKGGNIFQLVMMVRGCDFPEALTFIEKSREELPKITYKITGSDYEKNLASYEPIEIPLEWRGRAINALPIEVGSEAHQYLSGERKIGHNYSERFGLLDWKEKSRIIVPIRRERRMISWVARSYNGRYPKTIAPRGAPKKWELFNLDALDFTKSRVSIVEGWVDVIRLMQAGIVNPLGICGSIVSEYQAETISRFKEIDIWMDGDKAGEVLGDNIAGWFGRGCKIRVFVFPKGKDPGNYSPWELKQMQPLTWEEYRRQKNGEVKIYAGSSV